MERKIYITGSAGMVGSRFVELNSSKYTLLTPEIDKLNILDTKALEVFFSNENPNLVVHFAAFTNVGGAESQRGDKDGMCWMINVEGTKNLADVCQKYGVFMIHISTDMVFGGSREDPGPYKEDHLPEEDSDRLTWYGYSKAQAEEVVGNILGDKTTILRIIYPVRAKFEGKLDYLRKPLELYKEGKLYPLFEDQRVSISYVDEVCNAIEKLIDKRMSGVFHAASNNTGSPYEIIKYLVGKTGGDENQVKSTKLTKYQGFIENPVRYPMYGGLNVEETENKLGIKFSSWQEIIDKLVEQGINLEIS